MTEKPEIQQEIIKWIKGIFFMMFLFFFILFVGFLMGIVEFFKTLGREGKKGWEKLWEMIKDE